jgi:hypothetical protein
VELGLQSSNHGASQSKYQCRLAAFPSTSTGATGSNKGMDATINRSHGLQNKEDARK